MFKHFLAAIAIVVGISALVQYNAPASAADRTTVDNVYDKIKSKYPDADKVIITDRVAAYAIIDALVRANLAVQPNFPYDEVIIIRSEASGNSLLILLNEGTVVGSGVIPLQVLTSILREALNGS